MNGDTPLLRTTEVVRSYNGRRVLGPVTMSVEPGSVHAVLGKNGAGKSTLMKILAGFDRPDSGQLTIMGERLAGGGVHAHEAAGIAFVPQELTTFPGLTVADQVMFRRPLSPLGGWRRQTTPKRTGSTRDTSPSATRP